MAINGHQWPSSKTGEKTIPKPTENDLGGSSSCATFCEKTVANCASLLVPGSFSLSVEGDPRMGKPRFDI
jgi:hypothetical protein